MTNLYLILGYNNVHAWNENNHDEIDLDSVYHKTLKNETERQIFISALYLLDNNIHNMEGN